MNRTVVLAVAIATVVGATFFGWLEARRHREFRRLIVSGDLALAEDRTFDAIEAFSGAIALRHDSMLAHLKRGDTYRHRGDYAAALRDLRQAAVLDPSAPQPAELLGDVNVAMSRYERAIDDYRRYLGLDDRAPRVLYKLAIARYRFGQLTAALDAVRRALAIDARMAEAHYLMGLCLRDRGQPTEAHAAFTAALTLAPTLAPAREQLAELYARMGRRRDSVEQLEALAALEPGRAERLVAVGLAYARFGRPDEAILTLRRANERFPNTPIVRNALGRVWLEVDAVHPDVVSVAKALGALRPIAQRGDASSETLTLYGRALLASGQARIAERVLQDATTREPLDPTGFKYLAIAAARTGHAAVASAARVQYVALKPAGG